MRDETMFTMWTVSSIIERDVQEVHYTRSPEGRVNTSSYVHHVGGDESGSLRLRSHLRVFALLPILCSTVSLFF